MAPAACLTAATMPSGLSYAQLRGIAAKFAGVCVCGRAIEVGDRIFKLPPSRASQADPWVCWTCRWPSSATPTIDDVLRKLEHRATTGKSIGLNKAEVAVLADVFDGIVKSRASYVPAETRTYFDELRGWLRTSLDHGTPANLRWDDAGFILSFMDGLKPEPSRPVLRLVTDADWGPKAADGESAGRDAGARE